jgi:DNA-binding NarL/FixJ family response regulator
LAIVAAMGYELSLDVLRAARLSDDLRESQQRIALATHAANLGIWVRDLVRNEVWAVHEDADFAQAALDAGGLGYVVKARLASDLLPAIRAALADRRFISPTLRLDEARLTSPDPSDKPTRGKQ